MLTVLTVSPSAPPRRTLGRSRTVFVPFDRAGALCPFGDLFNYAPPPAPAEPEWEGWPLLPQKALRMRWQSQMRWQSPNLAKHSKT